MNLRDLTDETLLENTDVLAKKERQILTQVLHHLLEIESRRLFSKLGYTSLFDYCTKRLSYSGDQASRRISAMRLMRELPEIEQKIDQGSLTLTNISLAQQLFRKESTPVEDKKHLLNLIQHKSSREAEKIVFARARDPICLKPDRIRQVGTANIEIRFVADDSLSQKLDMVRGLLAHSLPNCGMAELIHRLCDLSIETLTPTAPNKEKKPRRASKLGATITQSANIHRGPSENQRSRLNQSPQLKEDAPFNRSSSPSQGVQTTNHDPLPHWAPKGHRVTVRKRVPVQLEREVWLRSGNKCQNCGSVHALQIDHIRPLAKGGATESQNLRLLCRNCNQRAAIEELGLAKMNPFINR